MCTDFWTCVPSMVAAVGVVVIAINRLAGVIRDFGSIKAWWQQRKDARGAAWRRQEEERQRREELDQKITCLTDAVHRVEDAVTGLRRDVDVLIRHDIIQEHEIERSREERHLQNEATEVMLEHLRTGNATGEMQDVLRKIRAYQRKMAGRPYGDEYNELLPAEADDIARWRVRNGGMDYGAD